DEKKLRAGDWSLKSRQRGAESRNNPEEEEEEREENMPLAQLADPWQKMPVGGTAGESLEPKTALPLLPPTTLDKHREVEPLPSHDSGRAYICESDAHHDPEDTTGDDDSMPACTVSPPVVLVSAPEGCRLGLRVLVGLV
ncbi:hypothetical protein GOODEAATRI_000690, partial [Goodea atripinnis]